MRNNYPKSQYITDCDFVALLKRLRGYSFTGKSGALVKSFLFWHDNRPPYKNVFGKHEHYIRGNQLFNKILRANEFPNFYIRARDRYTMLDLIKYLRNKYKSS